MIVESWRRVLATGLEPIDVLPSIEADPSETRERWLEHPLGLLRHVLVEPLQMLAEESNSMVQVTDPSGLTLYLGGPEWLKARAAEMNLVEGARCSETVNGTNGVGTALATESPCAGVRVRALQPPPPRMGLLRRADTRPGLGPTRRGH